MNRQLYYIIWWPLKEKEKEIEKDRMVNKYKMDKKQVDWRNIIVLMLNAASWDWPKFTCLHMGVGIVRTVFVFVLFLWGPQWDPLLRLGEHVGLCYHALVGTPNHHPTSCRPIHMSYSLSLFSPFLYYPYLHSITKNWSVLLIFKKFIMY